MKYTKDESHIQKKKTSISKILLKARAAHRRHWNLNNHHQHTFTSQRNASVYLSFVSVVRITLLEYISREPWATCICSKRNKNKNKTTATTKYYKKNNNNTRIFVLQLLVWCTITAEQFVHSNLAHGGYIIVKQIVSVSEVVAVHQQHHQHHLYQKQSFQIRQPEIIITFYFIVRCVCVCLRECIAYYLQTILLSFKLNSFFAFIL